MRMSSKSSGRKRGRIKIISSVEVTAIDRAILELLESKPEQAFNGRKRTFSMEVSKANGMKHPYCLIRSVDHRVHRLAELGSIRVDRGPTNDPQAAGLQSHVVTSIVLTDSGRTYLTSLRTGSIVTASRFIDLDDEQRAQLVLTLVRGWTGTKPPDVRSITRAINERDQTQISPNPVYVVVRSLTRRHLLLRPTRAVVGVPASDDGGESPAPVKAPDIPALPSGETSERRRFRLMTRDDVQVLLTARRNELQELDARRAELVIECARLEELFGDYERRLKSVESLLVPEETTGGGA